MRNSPVKSASTHNGSIHEILIDQGAGLRRVLFMAGGRVAEIWHDFDDAPTLIGAVYRLRIDQVFAGQNRASARLDDQTPVSIRLSGRDRVTAGQIVVATIIAAPRQQKPWQAVIGPRLAGAYMVLLPDAFAGTNIGKGIDIGMGMREPMQVSRALLGLMSAEAIAALKTDMEPHLPDGFGLILRRSVAGQGSQILQDELSRLLQIWQAGSGDHGPTGLVHKGGTLAERAAFHAPDARLDSADDKDRFNDAYEDAIAFAKAQPIMLDDGGKIWIEPTQALISIDLDTGAGDIEALLRHAPAMIAHQLRLRGLSGLVTIDVPRLSQAAAKRFTAGLAKAFEADPRHPEILGRSRGGLLEVRIPHGVPTLDSQLRHVVSLQQGQEKSDEN